MKAFKHNGTRMGRVKRKPMQMRDGYKRFIYTNIEADVAFETKERLRILDYIKELDKKDKKW